MKHAQRVKTYMLFVSTVTAASFLIFLFTYLPTRYQCPHNGGIFLIITFLGLSYLLTQLSFYKMQKKTKSLSNAIIANSLLAAFVLLIGSILWYAIYSCAGY